MNEIRCKECNRFLGTAHGTVIAEIKCANSSCKHTNQIKIIDGDLQKALRFKFPSAPTAKMKVEK